MKYNIYRIGIINPVRALSMDDIVSIRLMKDTNKVTEFYISLLESEIDDKIILIRDKFRQDLPDKEFEVSGDPEIGKSFKLDGGYWGTSKVIYIINEMIFITQNSVYAIHNKQHFRNIAIDDLLD